jgi:hypothetical protein
MGPLQRPVLLQALPLFEMVSEGFTRVSIQNAQPALSTATIADYQSNAAVPYIVDRADVGVSIPRDAAFECA